MRVNIRARRAQLAGAGSSPGQSVAEVPRHAALLRQVSLLTAGARAVIGYAPLPGEPTIDAALDAARQAGAQVLLPVVRPGEPLEFGELTAPIAQLPLVGKWRIREPEPTHTAAQALRICPPAELVVLIPGLAFDVRGARLGNGGGFYDRTFGPLSACASLVEQLRVGGLRLTGVCFEDEVLALIDAEPWDLLVDRVVTGAGVHATNT